MSPSTGGATPSPGPRPAEIRLGAPADADGPGGRDGCADADGCADRDDEGGADGEALAAGTAAAAGGVGDGEGGADRVGPAAGSISYVACALPVFGAEPLTTCEPVMLDDGVSVTLAEQVLPLNPGSARATDWPSHPNVTGPSQDRPNQPQEDGYDNVAVTGAPGAP